MSRENPPPISRKETADLNLHETIFIELAAKGSTGDEMIDQRTPQGERFNSRAPTSAALHSFGYKKSPRGTQRKDSAQLSVIGDQ